MNNSSIFTLDRKGNGFDLEEYPREIYVDTSVWNNIYGSQNTTKTKSLLTDFIGDCLEHDVTFYSSGIVHEELAHIIKRDIIEQEFKKIPYVKVPKYVDGKRNTKAIDEIAMSENPGLVDIIANSINEARNFVNGTSIFLPYEEDEETTDIMFSLIHKSGYQLDTRDIKHVLAAHTYDINSVLTCDGDYAKFDNLNVYVPPSEQYAKLKIGRTNVLLPFEKEKF